MTCSETMPRRSTLASILPPNLPDIVSQWLREDIPSVDIAGAVVGNSEQECVIFCKSTGILAGTPFVEALLEICECEAEWLFEEGQLIQIGCGERVIVAKIKGKACKLLQVERVALNILARASGIATRAHHLNRLKVECGWNGVVAGTRKTTPGFRLVEKYAMLVGGVDMHRVDLSSMIMLKDNHVKLSALNGESIDEMVKRCRSIVGFGAKIEVECSSLNEALIAAKAGADIVMLDNFTPDRARLDSFLFKKECPNVLVEVSGGLTEENITLFMCENVDILSCGSLTQGCPHVDFSMKIMLS